MRSCQLFLLLILATTVQSGSGAGNGLTDPPPAATSGSHAEVLASGANSDSGTATQPASSGRYDVAGHWVSVLEDATSCWLLHTDERNSTQRLRLSLRPPCYLLTWQAHPPRTSPDGVSDGEPVGKVGDPIAWRYRSAKGAIVIGVIGDDIPSEVRSSRYVRERAESGYRCAGSLQGVLLVGNKARVSKKREDAGVFCVEVQPDEKDFWMLAH